MSATDFDNAGKRHFKDANFLFDAQRYPNADQLYGLAVECALKSMMCLHLGAKLNSKDYVELTDKIYSFHIDKLWGEFCSLIGGKGAVSFPLFSSAPFDDWRVEQRYHNSRSLALPKVENHRNAADLLFRYYEAFGVNNDSIR